MFDSLILGSIFNFIKFIISLAPFWLPIVVFYFAWHYWLKYIRAAYLRTIKWTLLEVRVPRDVFKTPLAMEMVFSTAFHQTGGVGDWKAKYWEGKLLTWFSLEIVSIDGKVYFFIRVPTGFKQIVESQIYAQYPQAEINEVEDYTIQAPLHDPSGGWNLWGCEFDLTKNDVFPIKTYVDYGLDKSTSLEPEQQIDPITPLIEFMGSHGQGEQVWFQILIRATPDRFTVGGEKNKKITDMAKEQIKKLMKDGIEVTPATDEDDAITKMTKGQTEVISAIERNMDKFQFDCGMRVMYLAQADKFNSMAAAGLTAAIKQYNSNNRNGFKPARVVGGDYKQKLSMFNKYRLRSYFYDPHNGKPFVLSSEELATVYHFPGRVSETPSFARLDSKKAEPPQNLPT